MNGTLRELPAARRRVLVIAYETAESAVISGALKRRAPAGGMEVLVVAPALNSRLQHWASDHDRARHAADERLARSLDRLQEHGIDAQGWVGDADPMLAIEDALRFFGPDEIVISTHPERRSNWLARDVVGRARATFGLPVTDVVVDSAAGREYLLEAAA